MIDALCPKSNHGQRIAIGRRVAYGRSPWPANDHGSLSIAIVVHHDYLNEEQGSATYHALICLSSMIQLQFRM